MPELRTLEARERAIALNLIFERESHDPTTRQRRRRRGLPLLPVEIRNGMPFRPYVYRGTGYDIYTGLGDDDA